MLPLTDNVGSAESDGLEIDGSFLITENWDVIFGHLAFGLERDSWSAELFAKNVGDERGEVFINGATYDQRITSNRPRTIGLRFRHKFG